METPKGIQIPLYLWMAANNARTFARGLGIVPNTTGDGKKLSAPEGVPRPSPTLVLTGPYHAWLRSSKGIRYIHGSMADSECKGFTLNNNQNAICIADRFVCHIVTFFGRSLSFGAWTLSFFETKSSMFVLRIPSRWALSFFNESANKFFFKFLKDLSMST